jgi:hypothetical protein
MNKKIERKGEQIANKKNKEKVMTTTTSGSMKGGKLKNKTHSKTLEIMLFSCKGHG